MTTSLDSTTRGTEGPATPKTVQQNASHYPRLTKEDLDPLVRLAAKGDRDAMDGLLAALKPVVTRYCRARLGGRDLSYFSADDISQEVCVAVLKALPQYQDRGGSFLYLVHAIAANKVADAFRAVSRDRCEPVSDLPERSSTDNEPEKHALDVDLGERLNRLIRTLPRVQQEIVILRVAVGLTAAETAEAVGLKAGNVRTTQHRALQKLRELITLEGDF
ncbi:RNA polymerase sigma factor ShbA [Amycolatopsis magusensis]|uniref:RNA polymerase sigma-70 factor (ECF subfamily) n=1 Tax=Amycolatopsis magusensis TaxID=882444 RepID=A0ABS4Q4M2_9PSEU|nr:RNA polymerase sigma factor ShbA [Amycolatopsis magusensis]MBP2186625.1 RNA polymerase sigma-70 factor (ECF subfamily) [Amycolatopsis magusensis]MDI5980346.1 RNA polymerase sigma factor ShbA [Amycolatopsis magusensis]